MINLRKVIIIAVSVIAVFLIYFFVVRATGTKQIDIQKYEQKAKEDIASIKDEIISVGKIGDIAPGQITKARYAVKDPESKTLKKVFGFTKLLRQAGDNWDLKEPYIKMFEKGFSCEISSDSGTVAIKLVGNQPIPMDAKLNGNVVVSLIPAENSSMAEGYVYMDNVIFNSKNSQFSTDGPVRFVSKDAEIVGTGMQLIYNSMLGRIELMRIIDLEFIRLKKYKNKQLSSQVLTSETQQEDQAKTEDSSIANSSVDINEQSQNNIKDTNSSDLPGKTALKKGHRYRCVLSDNVQIKYGSQRIYADEVMLSNIVFSKKNRTAAKQTNKIEPLSGNDDSSQQGIDPNGSAAETDSDDFVDVIVKCDGGITFKPMERFADYDKQSASTGSAQNRMIEFKGQPVLIKQQDNPAYTIADCGFLRYDIDQQIMDMMSYRDSNKVSLNFEQSGAKLVTRGSVHWQRKANIAVINGPGRLTVDGRADKEKDRAELDFPGTMKLYFAGGPGQKDTLKSIKLVEFPGGITAKLFGGKGAVVNADSARISFGRSNRIVWAKLDGNVNVDSDSAFLSSDRARVYFTRDDNKTDRIDYIDLLDNVSAKTTDSRCSAVKADFGRFCFDQDRSVVRADIEGDIVLSSGNNLLYAQKVQVLFDKDPNGRSYISSAKTVSPAKIVSQTDDNRDAVFWAKQIDYDFTANTAKAKGPVKIEFYTKAAGIDANTPVVITARDSAFFDLKKNQITLSGTVTGKMVENSNGIIQISDFKGDKLIVDLVKDKTDNNSDMEHISVQGRKVILNSKKMTDNSKLSEIVLICDRLDYFAAEEIIIAAGSKQASQIQIDNSRVSYTEGSQAEGITFNRPCYSLIKNFDELKWYLSKGKVQAHSTDSKLYAGYIPVLPDGSNGDVTKIYAGRVEANFEKSDNGKEEIQNLTASDGVSYQDSQYQFQGGQLFFDRSSSFVRITGTSNNDCFFNGIRASAIEYNLETGKATAEMGSSPGMLYPQVQ